MSHVRWSARLLPDGKRLHLSDGPIDLIVGADGEDASVRVAYRAAIGRFATVLDELCAELTLLRRPATEGGRPEGAIAQVMWRAVLPHAGAVFITPMAAVAGAVAGAVLRAMTGAARLRRGFVNNGGDIALYLPPGATFTAGLVDRPDRAWLAGMAAIRGEDGVGGIATSGWRGRSFSRGIADAVTVLARDPAVADACATLIANEVDLPGHPGISRRPADMLQPDSDLGSLLVTTGVGGLAPGEIDAALDAGAVVARRLVAEEWIVAAMLRLGGRTREVGGSAR